ncbi:MAG: cupin [Alphaproteobacteria bacterium]|nr:cupin [Alphaproteobacteria bacterium]
MAQQHAKAGEIVDLRPHGDKLADARTVAIVKAKRFEAVRLIVKAGAYIAPHQVAGNVMLHCLEGQIVLVTSPTHKELSAGDWLYLNSREVHSIKGLQNSALLLTILFEESADLGRSESLSRRSSETLRGVKNDT